jgi:hypothetical protein
MSSTFFTFLLFLLKNFLHLFILLFMNEITASEIGQILGLKRHTVLARLRSTGIKPLRMVGATAIYAPDVVEQIRTARPAHRPPSKPAE